jgi:crossover junction endodeoxyribonuclease RusA
MSARTWTIEHLERPLTMNKYRTLHYHPRADYDARIRGEIAWLAKSARMPRNLDGILVTAHPIVRRGTTLPDVGACFPTVKAAIDGLVDIGVIPDDKPDHLRGLVFVAPTRGDHDALVLIVAEVLAEGAA